MTKWRAFTGAVVTGSVILAAGMASVVHAQGLATCTPDQLVQPDNVEWGALDGYRQFKAPQIVYPYGTRKKDEWTFTVKVLIGEDGRPQCVAATSVKDANTARRRAVLKQVADWRYRGYVSHGMAAPMVVTERIAEEEAPRRHVEMPQGELKDVVIQLTRSRCFGSCPDYSVTVHGDGAVVYEGGVFVAVAGRHSYRVAPEAVAALVEAARAGDLWSMRKGYAAQITDNATYAIAMTIGGQTKVVVDYVGPMVGMPGAVRRFEDLIDATAQTDSWLHLKPLTLERLRGEGFDFTSQASADLLAGAIGDSEVKDDTAILALMQAGAPIEGGRVNNLWLRDQAVDVLEEAVREGRTAVIDALLARGVLVKDGVPDQSRIDAAFQAAVGSGRLSEVTRLWSYHPGLTYGDTGQGGAWSEGPVKMVPVTLLLPADYGDGPWEGFEIARILVEQGCDVKASGVDGKTLLHIAASSESVAFVQYLIARGADVRALDDMGDAPLDRAYDQDVAIALLEAGADPNNKPKYGEDFAARAKMYGWSRALAWVAAHGQ